jgi:spoIIIJ-associated protein
MADPRSSIEFDIPAAEVEDAVARLCADWGLDRSEVQVEVIDAAAAEPALPGGTVRLRVTAASSAPEQAEDEALGRARQVVSELLSKMKVPATVAAQWGEPEGDVRPVLVDVQGDDLGQLIGRKGETLAALQYIARLIVSKQTGRNVDLIVDVQGHKRRREEQLRRMARRLAEQAVERQRVMTLEPMPANERRIIHLELRDHPDVHTESIGEGLHRKVTIIPGAA